MYKEKGDSPGLRVELKDLQRLKGEALLQSSRIRTIHPASQ